VRGAAGCWKEASRNAGEGDDSLLFLSPTGVERERGGGRGCWAPSHVRSIVRDAKEILTYSRELGKVRDSKNRI